MILVTGGAGFIGANFVLDWLAASNEPVINLDALTYAGNLETLARLQGDPRHLFVHGDICDRELIDRLLAQYRPRAIVHFAAESHVDRSIHGPGEFMRTNVTGTWRNLRAELRQMVVTPHVAQKSRHSAIDGRTTRHEGYALSIRHRKRIEEAFGWAKTVGGMAQTVYRGLERVRSRFILTMAANNLARLTRLLAV